MSDYLRALFSSGFFMPHGHCYLWRPEMVWAQVIANLAIGLAYVSISSTLYYIIRRIRDLPFQWMYLAFGVFIISCGLTHFLDVWTVWQPVYWLDAGVRILTAVASVGTALMLFPLVPKAIALAQTAHLSHDRGQKLEEANRELARLLEKSREVETLKAHFFAATSHELRTPLSLILGPLDKLLGDGGLTPERRRELATVAQNARLLLKHVNDILDVSKLEAGKMVADYSEADLGHLVRLTAANFTSLAAERTIDFQVRAPSGVVPAQVDVDKLERVLMNLLSNAFKFTPDGGQVRCSLQIKDPQAIIEVADSGPGIPPQDRERIFERFRQLDGGSTRRYGGTGLGLAIVRDFVGLHEGHIQVDQAPEGGARFVVELPMQAPAGREVGAQPPEDATGTAALAQATVEALRKAPPSSLAAGAPRRRPGFPLVLVVEDNYEMNRFVRDVLAPEYDVAAAFDGEEGHRQALALRPDLLISDVMMPGVSGEDLVDRVRRDPSLNAMQIMLLSARADDGLRVQLLQQGAQDYLMKPFSPGELRARAGNLITIKRARDVLQGELSNQQRDLGTLAAEVMQRQGELLQALTSAQAARVQAEQASKVKTDFLNLVTHELRTPLTGLKLQLDRLARDMDGLSERQRTMVRRMSESSVRLAELIDSVLEYARIESGKLSIGIHDIDLLRAAQQAEEELRPQAELKHLTLRVVAEGELPRLRSDARLLRMVLSNLIGNAIKFTQAGGIEVRCAYEAGQHRISVSDTGPGIDQDAQKAIFEPFTHIEPIHEKHTPGVGLGLALVREMVGALRGEVVLSSRTGQGSVFTVSLPSLLDSAIPKRAVTP